MRPNAFPRSLRIRRGREFDRAFKDGARASDALLTVVACANGAEHPRLGLAVSRKVGGAVVRNRVKRLLREAFRTGRTRLPAGHDLVVVPKEGDPARWSLEAVGASLEALAGKAAEKLARGGARKGRPPA